MHFDGKKDGIIIAHEHFSPTAQTILNLTGLLANQKLYQVKHYHCQFTLLYLAAFNTSNRQLISCSATVTFNLLQYQIIPVSFTYKECNDELRGEVTIKKLMDWVIAELNKSILSPTIFQALEQVDFMTFVVQSDAARSTATKNQAFVDHSILSLNELQDKTIQRFNTDKKTCFALDLDEVLIKATLIQESYCFSPVEPNIGNIIAELASTFKNSFFVIITHSPIKVLQVKLESLQMVNLDFKLFEKILTKADDEFHFKHFGQANKGKQLRNYLNSAHPDCEQIIFVDDQSHNIELVKQEFEDKVMTFQMLAGVPHRLQYIADNGFEGSLLSLFESKDYGNEIISLIEYIRIISQRADLKELKEL
ncbi:DUF2608 domain-containing protein [Parashewanella curva]|uniref:DUF2608 domain-containing protein n=1 Tax=Parashewanella curva TaxID=2338552 RepID=UPI0014044F19|nr:DUF2608 domain-containing protein [Parashewanella curva]